MMPVYLVASIAEQGRESYEMSMLESANALKFDDFKLTGIVVYNHEDFMDWAKHLLTAHNQPSMGGSAEILMREVRRKGWLVLKSFVEI